MPASASAIFSRANRRAFSASDVPRAAATVWAILFQWPRGETVPSPSDQKWAISVCSGVRARLSVPPRALTWLKLAVYSGVFSGGGSAGRNWDELRRQNGVTVDQCGSRAALKSGGVGRH